MSDFPLISTLQFMSEKEGHAHKGEIIKASKVIEAIWHPSSPIFHAKNPQQFELRKSSRRDVNDAVYIATQEYFFPYTTISLRWPQLQEANLHIFSLWPPRIPSSHQDKSPEMIETPSCKRFSKIIHKGGVGDHRCGNYPQEEMLYREVLFNHPSSMAPITSRAGSPLLAMNPKRMCFKTSFKLQDCDTKTQEWQSNNAFDFLKTSFTRVVLPKPPIPNTETARKFFTFPSNTSFISCSTSCSIPTISSSRTKGDAAPGPLEDIPPSSRGVLVAKSHYKLWGFTMIFLCDASSSRNKGYLDTKELTLIAWGIHQPHSSSSKSIRKSVKFSESSTASSRDMMKQNKVHQTSKSKQSRNKNDLTSFSPMSTALAIASSISATCCREGSTFTE
ncbi:hypothetical protein H5410_007310 [Solanum commersonii]|uniref:Uncharacterized protein n=1 Tax=Solanum commersonii TaxID=4109 RepID=A0A9J6ACR1_SOLCO|nr:hypothetical protein H5410_007310 [Solanum commersonii]